MADARPRDKPYANKKPYTSHKPDGPAADASPGDRPDAHGKPYPSGKPSTRVTLQPNYKSKRKPGGPGRDVTPRDRTGTKPKGKKPFKAKFAGKPDAKPVHKSAKAGSKNRVSELAGFSPRKRKKPHKNSD